MLSVLTWMNSVVQLSLGGVQMLCQAAIVAMISMYGWEIDDRRAIVGKLRTDIGQHHEAGSKRRSDAGNWRQW